LYSGGRPITSRPIDVVDKASTASKCNLAGQEHPMKDWTAQMRCSCRNSQFPVRPIPGYDTRAVPPRRPISLDINTYIESGTVPFVRHPTLRFCLGSFVTHSWISARAAAYVWLKYSRWYSNMTEIGLWAHTIGVNSKT
jgi:hypothetical protein